MYASSSGPRGVRCPLSQRVTAVRPTPRTAASSCWRRPACSRRSRRTAGAGSMRRPRPRARSSSSWSSCNMTTGWHSVGTVVQREDVSAFGNIQRCGRTLPDWHRAGTLAGVGTGDFDTVLIEDGGVRPQQDLGDGWHAIYTVTPDGRVTAIVVEPSPDTVRPLRTVMLRNLAVGPAVTAARNTARDAFRWPRDTLLGAVQDWLEPDWRGALGTVGDRLSALPPRKASQLRLIDLAARYVMAHERGDRAPRAAVARELGLSEEQVRDRLHEARVKGYLVGAPGAGMAGGRLSPAAIEILQGSER